MFFWGGFKNAMIAIAPKMSIAFYSRHYLYIFVPFSLGDVFSQATQLVGRIGFLEIPISEHRVHWDILTSL